MLISFVLFVSAFLLDSVILPGIVGNYYGYLVSIVFATSLVTVNSQRRLAYTLIILGLIYEISSGYTLGAYLLPLLIAYLLVVFADHYVNIRTYLMESGLAKYFIAPVVISICFMVMQYLTALIYNLVSGKYIVIRLTEFENWRFVVYLYFMSLIVYWLNRLILDKYAGRLQGNN
jgi:hypothetical protein